MRTVRSNGHTIFVKTFPSETVWYDGNEVSRSANLFGATHRFMADENGEQANYEVKMWSGLFRNRVNIHRNGTLIYQD